MRSNSSLVNELGDDLAWAFLVERKFGEKYSPENAAALIDQIRTILDGTTAEAKAVSATTPENRTQSRGV